MTSCPDPVVQRRIHRRNPPSRAEVLPSVTSQPSPSAAVIQALIVLEAAYTDTDRRVTLAACSRPRIFGQAEAASGSMEQIEAQTHRPSPAAIAIAVIGPPRRIAADSAQTASASRAIGMP